jgi:hypothetical protein
MLHAADRGSARTGIVREIGSRPAKERAGAFELMTCDHGSGAYRKLYDTAHYAQESNATSKRIRNFDDLSVIYLCAFSSLLKFDFSNLD